MQALEEMALSWTAPQTGRVEIGVQGCGFAPVLHVHGASCSGPELACAAAVGDVVTVEVEVVANCALVLVVDGDGVGDACQGN